MQDSIKDTIESVLGPLGLPFYYDGSDGFNMATVGGDVPVLPITDLKRNYVYSYVTNTTPKQGNATLKLTHTVNIAFVFGCGLHLDNFITSLANVLIAKCQHVLPTALITDPRYAFSQLSADFGLTTAETGVAYANFVGQVIVMQVAIAKDYHPIPNGCQLNFCEC